MEPLLWASPWALLLQLLMPCPPGQLVYPWPSTNSISLLSIIKMASINYIGDAFCYLKVSKKLASSSLLPTLPWPVSTIFISPSCQHSPLVTKRLCQQFNRAPQHCFFPFIPRYFIFTLALSYMIILKEVPAWCFCKTIHLLQGREERKPHHHKG